MSPAELDGADWEREVLGADAPVLVDFWAPWCAPCRRLEPVVADLAARYAGRLHVRRLDVDAYPGPAAAYDVLSLPTLILFAGGVPVERLVGAVKPRRLERVVTTHLSPA